LHQVGDLFELNVKPKG